MFYIVGQVLVCLLLTAALGVLAGWLVRGYHARAELSSMQRQLQRQARDLRNRSRSSTVSGSHSTDVRDATTDNRAQQQLRHQMVRLQAQLEQRDKEIAQLRLVIGDQRPYPKKEGSGTEDSARPGATPAAPRQRKPG